MGFGSFFLGGGASTTCLFSQTHFLHRVFLLRANFSCFYITTMMMKTMVTNTLMIMKMMVISMIETTMVMVIYILWCMCVCLSRKMITSSWESPVTTWTPHNHPLQLHVSFDGSRLVFHGSISVFIGFQWFRLVLMVFHGSRLDFHGSRSVFMV